MKISLKTPYGRRHGLFALAVLLLLVAGATLMVESNNSSIRSLAMVLLIFSVYCVRLSRSVSATIANQQAGQEWATRPSRTLWIVSIVLLPLQVMAFAFLYRDAVQGYREMWPVSFFAATAMICALCWAYLMSLLV
jgi:hypothetical protein